MTTRTHAKNKQAETVPDGQPKFQQKSYEIQRYGQQHMVPLGIPFSTSG